MSLNRKLTRNGTGDTLGSSIGVIKRAVLIMLIAQNAIMKKSEKKEKKVISDNDTLDEENAVLGLLYGRRYQNMTYSFEKISEYIINNEIDRERDYFYCSMRAIISDPLTSISDLLIKNLILAKDKKFKNGGKELIKLCEFDKEFEFEVEVALNGKIDVKSVFDGKKNYHVASLLLDYLKELKFESIRNHMVLHTLSNLVEIDIDNKFKSVLNTQKMYMEMFKDNFFDIFSRQILRGLLAECSIKKNLRKNFGFWFDQILTMEEQAVHSMAVGGRSYLDRERLHSEIFGVKNYSFYPETVVEEVNRGKEMEYSFWHNHYPEKADHKNICFECKLWLKLVAKDIPVVYRSYSRHRSESPWSHVIDKRTEKMRNGMNKEKLENFKQGKKQEVKKEQPGKSERMMIIGQMANRGNVRAINELAQHQYFGNFDQGIPVDREEAFRNYRRAAELGDVNAEANMGILSFQSKSFFNLV